MKRSAKFERILSIYDRFIYEKYKKKHQAWSDNEKHTRTHVRINTCVNIREDAEKFLRSEQMTKPENLGSNRFLDGFFTDSVTFIPP